MIQKIDSIFVSNLFMQQSQVRILSFFESDILFDRLSIASRVLFSAISFFILSLKFFILKVMHKNFVHACARMRAHGKLLFITSI